MMRSGGFEVYHYGVEGSDAGADVDVQLMTKAEWDEMRVVSYMGLHKDLTREQVVEQLSNPKTFVSELANTGTPLYAEFNRRLGLALKQHYRSTATDILCIPFGFAHDAAHAEGNYVRVETGIGYNDSKYNYRIFESYAWLNHALGKESKPPQNYWFVVPNYFDISHFPLSLTPEKKKKVARLLGLPVTEETKEEVVYNQVDNMLKQTEFKNGKYQGLNPVEVFNRFADMKENLLHIKDLVKQAITHSIYRVKPSGKVYEGEFEVANDEEELIKFLVDDDHQDDLITLEQKLKTKKLASV
jgi:hypothetical protein